MQEGYGTLSDDVTDDDAAPGLLCLVVGKGDTCRRTIRELRRRQAADPQLMFPRRVITRSHGIDGEVHQIVTPAQFQNLLRDGQFALWWSARGTSYAVPTSIDADLKAGKVVVVNVSRRVIPMARARFSNLVVVEVGLGPPSPGGVDILLSPSEAAEVVPGLARRRSQPRGSLVI